MITLNSLFTHRILSRLLLGASLLSTTALVSTHSHANTPRVFGPSLTTGETVTTNAHFIDFHNPATGALHRDNNKHNQTVSGSVYLGAGLEYGNIEDLFALIDDMSERIDGDDGSDSGDGSDGGDGGDGSDGNDGDNGLLPPDFDFDNPELEEWLDAVKKQVGLFGALLGFVAAEGYSKVHIGTEVPILINKDIWGGTLAFKFSSSRYGGALGIVDAPDFDEDVAKQALEDITELTPESDESSFDLSGGLILTVDPSTGKVSFTFNNDSVLLTKAVRANEISMDYSRHWKTSETGDLYIGIRPRVLRLGTSNVSSRIGDLTDASQFFDDIFNADYKYKYGWTADIGAILKKPTYHLGLNIKNLYEESFGFPTMDYSKIEDLDIKRTLESTRNYKLDRQLKLEGGINDINNRWSLNLSVDANAAMDPLRDLNQWLSISGDYQPRISWLPAVRAGYHKNLKGTRLEYIALGSTLFKYFDLDIGVSQDTVTIKDSELTRGLILNLGFNYGF